MTLADFKLGKKLGRVDDPRTFKLAEFLPRTALTDLRVPKSWRLAAQRHAVPMFRNDAIGDCTCASSAHRIIAQEAAVGQRGELRITDQDVIDVYSAVTGYPATGDNGAYMLDIANYLRRVGIGHEKDGTRHTVTAFVEVPVQKLEYVHAAAMIFGGLWVGVWLPLSAQRQTTWDLPAQGPTGDGEPGSWGGHAIYVPGFDESGLPFYTWARELRMTWAFWRAYVDEAWIFVTEDFLRRRTQETPRGFDVERLQGYLSELAG